MRPPGASNDELDEYLRLNAEANANGHPHLGSEERVEEIYDDPNDGRRIVFGILLELQREFPDESIEYGCHPNADEKRSIYVSRIVPSHISADELCERYNLKKRHGTQRQYLVLKEDSEDGN